MFLINSRQGYFRCGRLQLYSCWRQSILRTYGRFFAEFLQELSLVHLSTLTLTYLCRFEVRFLYPTAEVFLGRIFKKVAPAVAKAPPAPQKAQKSKSNNALLPQFSVASVTKYRRAGILTGCPSPTSFREQG